jgi:tRNA1(Val) A37 N6-methylase TrmN6
MNCAPKDPERAGELTDDGVLDGRLRLLQPRRGHRFGHDAILLAAATAARAGEHAADLGAGVGAAGLALAMRVPGLRVTLIEIEPALAALARENASRNGLGDRVTAVALDVTAVPDAFARHGLAAGTLDRVLMNPPFRDPARAQSSPDALRRRAHAAPSGGLASWITTAARLLRPDGVLTLIYPAECLGDVLAGVDANFGAVAMLPVHPRPGAAAIRVLVRATKGSRASLTLLPGFVLQCENGAPDPAAEAVLRHGALLELAEVRPSALRGSG